MRTKSWIRPLDPTDDGWAGFEDDRRELGDHISKVVGGFDGFVMSEPYRLTLTWWDSTTARTRSTVGGWGGSESLPILQSGPLDQMGLAKKVPFSNGCHTAEFERNIQYSTLEFRFGSGGSPGDSLCLQIQSYRVRYGRREEILSKRL